MSERIRRIAGDVRRFFSGGGAKRSSIDVAADSDPLVQRTAPTTFSSPQPFGSRDISNEDKLFASQREPIIKWLTYYIPVDVFDNWFKIVDPKNPDGDELDDVVQPVLRMLNAKQSLVRLFTYERRYGTAVLMCAYTGFGSEANWGGPIYGTATGLNLPIEFSGKAGVELLQITPYPWSKVNVSKKEESKNNLRYGLPTSYSISRGVSTEEGGTETDDTEVHWSRIIHAASRLDENTYEGESIVDAVWDDATWFRNSRWGQAETVFRLASGFLKFTFPWATREQISRWISSGEISNLNARGYFVCGEEGEDVESVGVQDASLNPQYYNELAWDMMALATRVPKDMLRGVSAGTIAGSEVNERSYWNFISSEQILVEPVVRELVDRLIDTGQIKYSDKRRGNKGTPSKDYEIQWNYPQIVSEQSRAQTDFLKSRMKSEMTNWLTVNEIRALEDKLPVPGGDVVLGILKGTRMMAPQETRPTPESRRPEEQIHEENQQSKQ